MRIVNRHERIYPIEPHRVGSLVDTLGTSEDRLWPRRDWPPMVLRPGLAAGAAGGHGPIRYVVQEYDPGRSVVFAFTHPPGWAGTHRFVVRPLADGRTRLTHLLEMEATGTGLLKWLAVFRPLHDALIEEALDRVEVELGVAPPSRRGRSRYVRLLRWLLSSRRKAAEAR